MMFVSLSTSIHIYLGSVCVVQQHNFCMWLIYSEWLCLSILCWCFTYLFKARPLLRRIQQKTKGWSGTDMEGKKENWLVRSKQRATAIFSKKEGDVNLAFHVGLRGTNHDPGLLLEPSLRPLSYSLPHFYMPSTSSPLHPCITPSSQLSFWHLLIPRPLTPGNLLSQPWPFSFSFPSLCLADHHYPLSFHCLRPRKTV